MIVTYIDLARGKRMQTGHDLKQARACEGLSQRKLAQRAGISHKAVQYWEAQSELDANGYAPKRMAAVLRRRIMPPVRTRARGGVLSETEETALLVDILGGMPRKLVKQLVAPRVICGAKTRSGAPCRAKSEPGRKRCRFHGGLSTGPKTVVGRKRISEAQKARWRVNTANDSDSLNQLPRASD